MRWDGDDPDAADLARWARAWTDPVDDLARDAAVPDGHADSLGALGAALATAIAALPPDGDRAVPASALVAVEVARAGFAEAMAAAAAARRRRFASSSDPRDGDLATACFRAALGATVPTTIEHVERQVDVARALRERRASDQSETGLLEGAIAIATSAVASLRHDRGAEARQGPAAPLAPAARRRDAAAAATGILAELLADRFEVAGGDADLDRAVDLARASLAGADPASRPARAAADDRLALLLRLRHDHRGDPGDLDEAIAHAESAASGTSRDEPTYPVRLGNLGLRLATRFSITGQRVDLDRSIDLAREGLAAGGLSPHERRRLLGNLAIRLNTRHEQAGDPADLDAAIAFEEEALALAPPGTSQPLWLLNNHGTSISARYSSRGDPADLDRAISLAEEALALSPPGSADRPSRLNNLGIVLSTRYEHRGDPADLDRAVDLSAQAVSATPPGSPFLNIRQHNHGTHLAIRYDRQGAPGDLDGAIEQARASIDGTPPDSPDRPSRHENLSLRLAARHVGRGRDEDLEGAIREGELALATTPGTALERPNRLANLARSLGHRWLATRGGPRAAPHAKGPPARPEPGSAAGHDDLDRAIALTLDALALMDPGNPQRATRLAALAGLLQWRHEATREASDRAAAIVAAEESVATTPAGHPGRAARLSQLASLLATSPPDDARALDLHREAWAAVTGSPGVAGFAVVDVGNGLASSLRARFASDPDAVAGELSHVLTTSLDALDGYLARLPLDADADALHATGTYGHLHAWLIEVTLARAEAALRRGEAPSDLLRATYAAIERSKGRRLVSRLQAGALRPTAAAQPLVDALERIKPELDRLEALLFGDRSPARRAAGDGTRSPGDDPDDPAAPAGSGATLGWLRERGAPAIPPPSRAQAGSGGNGRWGSGVAPAGANAPLEGRRAPEMARLAARHAELHAHFAALLRQVERSDPAYATARGYAAPRSPEEVARALPRGSVLLVLAALPARTAVVVLRTRPDGPPELAVASAPITEAQWSATVEAALAVDASDPVDRMEREVDGALRAISDKLVPAIAPLLHGDAPEGNGDAGLAHLVLVPTGAMHRLPLHALPWAPRGIARWDGKARLLDRHVVSYASTADLLPLVDARPVAPGGVAALAPGLALRPGDPAPHATVALAAALARRARAAPERAGDVAGAPPDVDLRVRAAASRGAVLGESVLAGRRFGFVATHGRAGSTASSGLLVHAGRALPRGSGPAGRGEGAPDGSEARGRWPGATAADGTWVTAAEMLARLDLGRVDHLQLLACSTHADDPAPGDHLATLLAAMLIRGARSVGGTLWPVDEVAAVLVGWRFGTSLLAGETDKARSLRDAVRWLRTASGAEVGDALRGMATAMAADVPGDPAIEAVSSLARRFAAGATAGDAPFSALVHWAPYVLHGAPVVGHHA